MKHVSSCYCLHYSSYKLSFSHQLFSLLKLKKKIQLVMFPRNGLALHSEHFPMSENLKLHLYLLLLQSADTQDSSLTFKCAHGVVMLEQFCASWFQ